jgi:hypothetical protein
MIQAVADDLRAAHDDNDELIERIDSGRRFKNDTDRLKKLFALYTNIQQPNKAKKLIQPLNQPQRQTGKQ